MSSFGSSFLWLSKRLKVSCFFSRHSVLGWREKEAVTLAFRLVEAALISIWQARTLDSPDGKDVTHSDHSSTFSFCLHESQCIFKKNYSYTRQIVWKVVQNGSEMPKSGITWTKIAKLVARNSDNIVTRLAIFMQIKQYFGIFRLVLATFLLQFYSLFCTGDQRIIDAIPKQSVKTLLIREKREATSSGGNENTQFSDVIKYRLTLCLGHCCCMNNGSGFV